MKEESVKEEKGKSKEVTPVVMDQGTKNLLEKLQAKIDKLETKDEASLLSQLMDKIGGRGASSNSNEDGQFKFNQTYEMSDIDPDDILSEDDWVTFVTHRVYHFICDDKRAGKNVPAPFEVIKFKYESTRQIKAGKETELIQMCTYTCKSKIELKWLREHSTFGVVFFDKIKGTEYSRDFERSRELTRQMTVLQTMGHQDLITMARSRGLNPGDMDLGSLRASIAISVADEKMNKKSDHTKNAMLEQHLEAKTMGREVSM